MNQTLPATIEVDVIEVTRRETRQGNPMWVLRTAGGGSLYIFDNNLNQPIWQASGYRPLLEQMEVGQVQRWETNPIRCLINPHEQYPPVLKVRRLEAGEKPNSYPRPTDVWVIYEHYWRSVITQINACPTVVFDTETTGTYPQLDEIVSIAITMYPNSHAALAHEQGQPTHYYSLVRPKNPEKLLHIGVKGTSAYDINGIHPDHLVRASTFPAVYNQIREIMADRVWLCWNVDFDATLLDSLCIRNGLPLIPRIGMWCVMKTLSPMVDDWDRESGSYNWQKLEEMADFIHAKFPDAHNAQADVAMTIKIIQWAERNLAQRNPF